MNDIQFVNLKCEYSVNPIGIMSKRPCFSFQVKSMDCSLEQSSYRLLVAESIESLEAEENCCMDTGLVLSSRTGSIVYSGAPIKSKTRYYWRTKIWAAEGVESNYSPTQWFESGILNKEEWTAKWIGSPVFGCTSPCFRKDVYIEDNSEIVRARAYITGLGYYKISIDGQWLEEQSLRPAFTDINKRVLYNVYDITEFMGKGKHVVGVMLGCGFYNSVHFNTPHRTLQFMLQLEIELADGTKKNINTDRESGWVVTAQSPIIENGIYDGEVFDSTKAIGDWNTDKILKEDINQYFKRPIIMPAPSGKLEFENLEPIIPVKDIAYEKVKQISEDVFVYDLGQNIAGYVKIKVNGKRDTKITLSYSELISSDGTVNKENLRTAKATDVYIMSGDGEESYEPYFTNHGFRYVQVEITNGCANILSLVGRWVRSACEKIGKFQCSNEMLNKLHKAIVYTEGNNLQGLPVDCPQRDERLGWINDAVVRTEEAVYNYDVVKLLSKWINDIHDTQDGTTGAIADTAPHIRYGRYPADPVCSSYFIVPWILYLHYGNANILKEHYEGMKLWNHYIGEQATDFIVEYSSYGDWAGPLNHSIAGSAGIGAVSAITPGELMSTGYYYYNSILLGKIARVLGNSKDEIYYKELANCIKSAFNQHFYNKELQYYGTNSQACNVFPLYLGIVEEKEIPGVVQNVINDIQKNDMHLTTGNLCTKYILEVLTEQGHVDIAYALATVETYPSWGYMLSNGATTIWERFELVETGELCEMASYNHPMYGSIGAWFYKMLAGIMPDEQETGFTKVIIRPYMPTNLEYVTSSVNTIKGKICVSWTKFENGYNLDVEIPCGSQGSIAFYNKPDVDMNHVIITENKAVIWKDGSGSGDIHIVGNRIESTVNPGIYSYTYQWGR